MNEPYSGLDGLIYSARRHGRRHGVRYLELEINNALLRARRTRRAAVAAPSPTLVASPLEPAARDALSDGGPHMRIVLIGQAAFAEQVLDGVRDRGHEVVAVYCPPDARRRQAGSGQGARRSRSASRCTSIAR